MTVTTEMPRYQSHKIVHALKIASISQGVEVPPVVNATWQGSWLLHPEDTRYAAIEVPHQWFVKHAPKDGGYYVVYADGYKSFSPAEAFESGYTKLS